VGLDKANLTRRDLEILDTLTLRVRVLSLPQVAATWFGEARDAHRAAERRLIALDRRGLILRFVMAARPPLELDRPLASWQVGQAPPEFSTLAAALARRWRQRACPVPCVIATRSAGTWLGGHGGRQPRRSEISHDLTLANVYLRWRCENPYAIGEWYSESRLSGLGFGKATRLPDALVRRDGQPWVVEVGGLYSADKLADFHAFCSVQGLPYELW